MQRKKQVQDAATRQMEALQRHRAEREAAAKIEQGARFENLNMYFNSNSVETTSTSREDSDEAMLAEHEARWATIETAACFNTATSSTVSSPNEHNVLTYSTLPWPPFGDNLQKYLLALGGNLNNVDSTADLRRAYTRACLRWHPDKFQHRFRRVVHEEHLVQIMERVQDIAQGINQAYQELRQDF
jgi:hypothetical protein